MIAPCLTGFPDYKVEPPCKPGGEMGDRERGRFSGDTIRIALTGEAGDLRMAAWQDWREWWFQGIHTI
jgi:hypothetical protein